MPCHAPLNHSGGNRLGCVALHPLLPCSCPQNWPLPTRSPKNRTCQAGPPLPRTILLYRPRAGVAQQLGCITACSVFVRATRSEHQRSRERHIARCDRDAQEQNEVALCRNCDCQGITVEVLGKAGSILPLTDPDERRCTTMIAPRNPEVLSLRCISNFPEKRRARIIAPLCFCSVPHVRPFLAKS